MSSNFIDDFARRVTAANFTGINASVVGCTDAEIAHLESRTGVKFPSIYRAFLLKMGKSTAGFLRDEDRCHPELLTLKDSAVRILERSGSDYKLPKTAFVFWMSENGYFLFFDTMSGDNPPVYLYHEGDPEPVLKDNHFSETLDYMLATQIEDLNSSVN